MAQYSSAQGKSPLRTFTLCKVNCKHHVPSKEMQGWGMPTREH